MARKTKTLYVREQDEALWAEAESLAGESLSAFVAESLQRLIDEKKRESKQPDPEELRSKGFQSFEIPIRSVLAEDQMGQALSVREERPVVFWGKWIAEKPRSDDWKTTVYLTPKGKLVFYSADPRPGKKEFTDFRVFDNLDEAVRATVSDPGGVIEEQKYQVDLLQQVAKGIGQPWARELDI